MPKNSPETDILPTLPSYPRSDGPLNASLLAWQRGKTADGAFAQRITLQQPWQTPPSTLELRADYRFTRDGDKVAIRGGLDGCLLALDQPVALQPVAVDKPWGRELWFTGMESRGESQVVGEQVNLPLSAYLALAPERLCRRRPIVLLKILEPNPQPLAGDLYFEVHDQKREVYVVTHVDGDAWPNATGAIRFGMNQQRRADFEDDDAFRAAYLMAVKDYEATRRSIDAGGAAEASLESAKRQVMDSFTNLMPVVVGDVIEVPTWVPHSLQHGVRVVEFQTPSYERFIISFAQQARTQDHWDSDYAIAKLTLDVPENPALTEVSPGVTQIVAFEDFSVWRIELGPGATCRPALSIPYAVCMNLHGGVKVGGHALGPENACFVPHAALPLVLNNPARQTSVSLIAAAGE